MTQTGKQMIGSMFSAEGSETFNAVNPATGEILEPSYYEATADEVDRAFQAAEKAFWVYRQTRPVERAAFLDKIAEKIVALGDALIKRCHRETGLPEARLTSERGRTVNQLKLFAEVVREGSWVEARIDTAMPERKPLPKPGIRRMLIPLGPVGIFGAGNFPLAFSVAGGDSASALAAGCPIVVKAHPAHPGTSELVAQAIVKAAQETGMPEGVFSMVHGRSTEVGTAVVNHPLTKAVGFTGSYAGGKALYDEAVRRDEPIPVYAEMGSTNPVFILPGALKERGDSIAQNLVGSVTLGVGQFCTNPGLVFLVKHGDPDPKIFIKKTAKILSAVPAGIMLTGKIKEAYDSGIEALTRIKGVSVAARGTKADGGCRGVPHLLQAAAETFIKNPRLAEEVFGPSTLVITASNKEELINAASVLKGHLTASIHCTDKDLQDYPKLVDLLKHKVGRLIMNGFPTGVEVCPSMHHGGPFPATADLRTTSVGTAAIKRFARPLCYQDFPPGALPDALKDENPLNIFRLVNGQWTAGKI
jgi:NADP-dependent aldehyde dehydrogenase